MTTQQTENEDRLENTLGELLHRSRKAKHKTIEEAAQATRIHANFLRALETDDFEKLPAEVFVRGFIRLYATYLGLDPDDTFKHYASQEDIEHRKPKIQHYQKEIIDDELMDRTSIFIKKKKSKILPVTILLAILILFYILGSYFRSEDRYTDLPPTTEITAPQIEIPPEQAPKETLNPEEPVSEIIPASPEETIEAEIKSPSVKAPQYTKQEVVKPEHVAPAEKKPATVTEKPANSAGENGTTLSVPSKTVESQTLPLTVKVATEKAPTIE